jgi:hypothetical protein
MIGRITGREYDLLLVSGRVLYLRSSAVRFESLTLFRPLLFPGSIEALYIFSSFFPHDAASFPHNDQAGVR